MIQSFACSLLGSRSNWALARVLLAAMASAAIMPAADPIPGLCNTGVVGTCNGGPGTLGLQAVGSADLNWGLATPAPSAPSATPITTVTGLTFGKAFVNSPDSGWTVNGPASEWITPPVENSPGGYYVYQTTFTIPSAYLPSTAMISGTFTSDNEGISIFLNGSLVTSGVVFPGPGDSGSPFTGSFNLNFANAVFTNGNNTLVFVIRNRGQGGIDSSNTPTGLRVEFNSQLSTVELSAGPLPQTGGNPVVYTQNSNLSAFTSCAEQKSGYATFVAGVISQRFANYIMPYQPKSADLTTTDSPRVIGTDGLPPIVVDFGKPVSQILVFPSIDHVGLNWDAFQYNIWGSNKGPYGPFYLLFDPTSVIPASNNLSLDPPFTLGAWTGQGPTLVNNTLPTVRGWGGYVAYEAYFNFSSSPSGPPGSPYTGAYRWYAFRTSTFAKTPQTPSTALELEEELAAVAEAVPCSPAFVEVCKSSSSVNPVTGSFTFTSPAFTSAPGNSITVPVGSCSGPIPVPPGPVTISEGIHPPQVVLSAVAASGYNSSTSLLENRLVSSNLAVGSATVTAVAGDVPFETVVNFTNQGQTGNLKICKIAGQGVAVGTNYNFTATSGANAANPGTSQNYTVPAGPASEGGYCVIDSTTFPVGTKVTVAEAGVLPGSVVTSSVSPAGTTGGSSIVATLGSGFTEVTFTNSRQRTVNPITLVFTAALPGPADPQSFDVVTTPPAPFTAAVNTGSGPAGWLIVNPTQGTTPATLTATVAATLPVGTYTGTITIASSGAGNGVLSTIPVTYTVLAPGTGTRSGVLSHIAAGGGWDTAITLANTSSAPISVTVAFHADDGSALTLPLTVTQQGGTQTTTTPSLNAVINPNATLLIDSGAKLASTVVGWADVSSSAPLGGYAIFRSTPQTGSPSEGTVPLQSQFPSTMTLAYDNSAGFVMGVAIANLSTASADITATVWDDSGVQLGTQVITIAGSGHTSFVLPSQIPVTAGKRGIVQFQSTAPGGIGGLGLRFSPFGTFTSVPTMLSQ